MPGKLGPVGLVVLGWDRRTQELALVGKGWIDLDLTDSYVFSPPY